MTKMMRGTNKKIDSFRKIKISPKEKVQEVFSNKQIEALEQTSIFKPQTKLELNF